MTTLRDLIGSCPGCGKVVVYPFTQDLEGAGRQASETELRIMRGLSRSANVFMREVGTRIPTVTKGKELWHKPCYDVNRFRLFQVEIEKIIKILQSRQ